MWHLQFQFLLVRSSDRLCKGHSILVYIVFLICNRWRYMWLDPLVELFSNKLCWCICYSEIMSSNFDSRIKAILEATKVIQKSVDGLNLTWTLDTYIKHGFDWCHVMAWLELTKFCFFFHFTVFVIICDSFSDTPTAFTGTWWPFSCLNRAIANHFDTNWFWSVGWNQFKSEFHGQGRPTFLPAWKTDSFHS